MGSVATSSQKEQHKVKHYFFFLIKNVENHIWSQLD